jgi:SulP family sulfate permease
LIIPVVFYIVILGARFNLDTLRRDGWLFEVARSEEKWYRFYTYFGAFHCYLRIPFIDHV